MTNIIVRISPFSSHKNIQQTLTQQLKVKTQNSFKQWNFLRTGNEFCSQQDIFDEIGLSIIDKISKGSNEIVIALDEKCSRKTNILFGNNSKDKGLISMMIQSLKHKGYQSSLSCYQILNEQIFDLFNHTSKTGLLIDINKQLNIIGLKQTKLTSNQNVEQLLAAALKNRKQVKLNLQNQLELDKSIVIVTVNIKHEELKNNKIFFVKFSEQKINKLTDSFIKTIKSFGQNCSYSQSKLTQIIGHQIQNNCGIHVIAHVHLDKKYQNETLFALNLANKIKSLQGFQNNIYEVQKFLNQINQPKNSRNNNSQLGNDNNKIISNYELQRMIQHENHLKNIIRLYQNRCQIQKAQVIQFEKQKKILQNLTNQYSDFFKNLPTFPEIIFQNNQLKQQLTKQNLYNFKNKNNLYPTVNSISSFDNSNSLDLVQTINKQNLILQQYQSIISIFKQQFLTQLFQLSLQYSVLEKRINNSHRIQPKPSIKNFIYQDEEIDLLKTQIQLLKQQNHKLRSKNKQLELIRQKQGLTLLELDYIKTKLVEIHNSLIKDQQIIRNGYLQQIQKVKQLFVDRSDIGQQQNVTIKKFNISIKPTHKSNDTQQTFFLTQTNRNIPTQNNLNKYRISISKSIEDSDILKTTHVLSNSHRIQDVSILQSSHMRSERSYYNSTQKMIKPQNKERSQLERLKLFLLKSKQKTQRTKLTSQERSIKNSVNNIVYSKSSIFQRTQYSTLSNKYKNKPKINVDMHNKTESKKTKDIVSFGLRKN